jgi:hypothetical protein
VQNLLLKVNTEFVGLQEIFSLLDYKINKCSCFLVLIFTLKGPTAFLQDYTVDLHLLLCILNIMCCVYPITRDLTYQDLLISRCFLTYVL